MRPFFLRFMVVLMPIACFAGDLEILPESFFSVVTHKAGLLSGLGHNHLVFAKSYTAKASLEENNLASFRLEMTVPVANLVVDDPSTNTAWFPQLQKAQILEDAFSEVSEKNRKKIHESMVGNKQLQEKKFPEIRAWVESLNPKMGTIGDIETNQELTFKFEIRGVQRSYQVPAAVSFENGQLKILAIAPLKFSDFGMEPYSAMLGSVANDDRFHIFVSLIAKEQSP
jgi:hypothetical protein